MFICIIKNKIFHKTINQINSLIISLIISNLLKLELIRLDNILG